MYVGYEGLNGKEQSFLINICDFPLTFLAMVFFAHQIYVHVFVLIYKSFVTFRLGIYIRYFWRKIDLILHKNNLNSANNMFCLILSVTNVGQIYRRRLAKTTIMNVSCKKIAIWDIRQSFLIGIHF